MDVCIKHINVHIFTTIKNISSHIVKLKQTKKSLSQVLIARQKTPS